MATIVIDAGHGGEDAGGRSVGTAEKHLVLRYAGRLGSLLKSAGHRVIYTRVLDVFVPLAERAKVANEEKADLFVSIHANASGSPLARGPWTIHAAGSKRGEEIARALQATMARVMVGNPDSVFPDASPWVGGRRLAVLRQTTMPAVLLELGFMTSAADMALLEDPRQQERLCSALADTLVGLLPPVAVVRPVQPAVIKPVVKSPALDLKTVPVPTAAHVAEILRVRGVPPANARAGLEVAEVLLRGVVRGTEGAAREGVKQAADALADWITQRVRQ